jgi:hypothetical protein
MNETLNRVVAGAILLLAGMLTGCTSGPSGTYSDANGAVLLELKSGGKANITFMGEVADCSYSTSSNQLTLDCKPPAGKIPFTIHDDGSLTGPPGGFMPMLRKQK